MKFIYFNFLIFAIFSFVELSAIKKKSPGNENFTIMVNGTDCSICTPTQKECFKQCMEADLAAKAKQCLNQCKIIRGRFLNFNIYQSHQNYYNNLYTQLPNQIDSQFNQIDNQSFQTDNQSNYNQPNTKPNYN